MFSSARWICDSDFAELAPRPLLRRARASDQALPHRDDLLNRHGLFRTACTLTHRPGTARLRLTADDWYRV